MPMGGEEAASLMERLARLVAEVDGLGRSARERDLPEALAGAVERVFAPRVVLVFLERRRHDGFVLMASRGYSAMRSVRVTSGQGLVGQATELRRAVRRTELRAASRRPRGWEADLDLAVPIRVAGHVLGAIAIGPGPTGPETAGVLELVGAIAGLAILNARAAGERGEARYAADFDPLTGLRNKRSFLEALDRAVEHARVSEGPLALLIFDIDHFKHYNDHHGHPAGDRVLEEIGALVRRGFRGGRDVAGRFGGEEFMVLFPDTPKVRAHELAERFRAEVEAHSFKLGSTQPGGRLTVSGGVAAYPADAGSAVDLLEVADRWLYEAKRMSRNRISIADGIAGPRVTEITTHR